MHYSLIHGLFRCALLSFQLWGMFQSSFCYWFPIKLHLDPRTYFVLTWIHLNLLRLVLWTRSWSIFGNVLWALKRFILWKYLQDFVSLYLNIFPASAKFIMEAKQVTYYISVYACNTHLWSVTPVAGTMQRWLQRWVGHSSLKSFTLQLETQL